MTDTQDLIHGAVVSYQAEGRATANHYGILDIEAPNPIMLSPGLNASFGVDVEKLYAEIPHTPAHDSPTILECVRNVRLGEDLPFHLEAYPQATLKFPLLPFITGSATGLGDSPDSTSWMKELDDHWSVYTGVMFEDYKCEIPERGAVKETISGFAGDRATVVEASPALTEAVMNTSDPLVWNDIKSIKMGDATAPTDPILHCLTDISFGFTNEVAKWTHPESELSTKICGVRVVARKMFVSLKLGWVDQDFLSIVTGSDKKYLELQIGGVTPNILKIEFGGLYFPKYSADAKPKEIAGDTITAIVDQPTCIYSFI